MKFPLKIKKNLKNQQIRLNRRLFAKYQKRKQQLQKIHKIKTKMISNIFISWQNDDRKNTKKNQPTKLWQKDKLWNIEKEKTEKCKLKTNKLLSIYLKGSV